MADNLNIKVSTEEAQKKILAFNTAVKTLTTTLQTFSKSGDALRRVAQDIANIKPINAAVAQSLKNLNAQTAAMANSGNITTTTNSLNKLGQVKLSQTTQGLNQISQAVSKLGSNNGLSKFPAQTNALAASLDRAKAAARTSAAALAAISSSSTRAGTAATQTSRGFRNATESIRQYRASMAEAKAIVTSFTSKASNLSNTLNGLRGKFEVQAVIDFGKAVFEAGKTFQQFELATRTISEVGVTARQLKSDIVDMANSTATDVTSIAQNFQQFSIAAKLSGQSVAESRKIFTSFSTALRVMGKDSNSSKLAFLALTQMVSKGTIQSEELRRQLAEQLPGAFELFAQAAGTSASGLQEMMKKGEALTKDILPKAAELIRQKFGPGLAAAMETPIAKMTLLGNKVTELQDIIARGDDGTSGAFAGLTKILDALQKAAGSGGAQALAAALGGLASISLSGLSLAIDGIRHGLEIISVPLNIVIAGFEILGSGLSALDAGLQTVTGNIVTLGGLLGDAKEHAIGFGTVLTSLSAGLTIIAGKFAVAGIIKWGGIILSVATQGATALMGMAGASSSVTAGLATASVAARALSVALVATGIGAVAVAVGTLIPLVQEWWNHAEKVEQATQAATSTLIEVNPELKKNAEQYRAMATATGMSTEKVDEYVAAMIRSQATTDDMAEALRREIQQLQQRDEMETNAINRIKAKISFMADEKKRNGELTESQQRELAVLEKRLITLTGHNEKTRESIGLKQELAGTNIAAAEAEGIFGAKVENVDNAVNRSRVHTEAYNKAKEEGVVGEEKLIAAARAAVVEFQRTAVGADKAAESVGKIGESSSGISKVKQEVSGMGQEAGKAATNASKLASEMNKVASARSKAGLGGSLSARGGGVAGSITERTSTGPNTFSGKIPHFAEGTANTSTEPKRSAGGIPAIVHPNEAIVPLSKGRAIPVQIKSSANAGAPRKSDNTNKKEIFDDARKAANIDSQMNAPSKQDIKVEMHINTLDVDSFQKSENQILRDFAVKMGEALQQYG